MVNLRLQRRLASSILGVGLKRVWVDPNEVNEVALANSRKAVQKLIKDSFIIKKKIQMHSRQRARLRQEERRVGRHTGFGKRHGTREARMPVKVLWVRRQRTLRRLLKKYREAKKIDKHLYHDLYLAVKASQYKSKKNLADAIEKIIYKKNLEGKAGAQKQAFGTKATTNTTKTETKPVEKKQEKVNKKVEVKSNTKTAKK